MMIAMKGGISIYNEEAFCLSSLSMLILSLSAILIKDVPDWELIALPNLRTVYSCCVNAMLFFPTYMRIMTKRCGFF